MSLERVQIISILFGPGFGPFMAKHVQRSGFLKGVHTQVFGFKKRMLFVQETMASLSITNVHEKLWRIG